ncbi:MAG: protein adenylyltransferase SelO [Pseudomonadales bacterium]
MSAATDPPSFSSGPEAPAFPSLDFDNRFTRELPADPDASNSRRQISNALYVRVKPQQVAAPRLVACAPEVAQLIGLGAEACESAAFAEVFSGNRLLAGMDPHATCYGGHQFGNWAGQLGDGRAINLGEVRGVDGSLQMLQLKGAGPTPFSRTADGLAVLRSSLREFLCSEAMHHLGVPTTRALSLVLTGEQVMRDMLYDGHPALEPGAVVCRVAPTFVRFGHFQMLSARGEEALLRQFTDFIIVTEFSHLFPGRDLQVGQVTVDDYVVWFRNVCKLTAAMVVEWLRVGFVHGVMNTDNMSVTGLTIDYGPYGWLDDYDPDWTPNTTDAGQRRYRFGQQAAIAQWNLMQLANAILPLLGQPEPLEEALAEYARTYQQLAANMLAAKLGLPAVDGAEDMALFEDLEKTLCSAETDMTLFYRALMQISPVDTPDSALATLGVAFYDADAVNGSIRSGFLGWLERYIGRISELEPQARRSQMQQANPKYVLRNYLAQLAIDDAEQGDFGKVHELLDLLRRPYDEQPEHEQYAARRPDWARTRVGCSQLSCSS